MKNSCFAVLILSFAALPLVGCGGGGNPFAQKSSNELLFVSAAQTWDLDKNNSVTCEEWQRYTTELFNEADRDKDGALTLVEYKNIVKADRLFQTADHGYFDSNKDGKVVIQEMTSKPNPAFRLLDKNNDCQIGPNEMVHTRQIQALKSTSDGAAPADLPGSGPGGTGGR
ncbi:MAG: histidine kinase [Filomicrobium sp.]